MKLIPFALIFASAIFCSTIRNKIDPTPTPLPTLGDVPTPTKATSPSSTEEVTSGPPAANALTPSGATVSGGVLNGKAKSLPKPEYPPAAKAVKASGAVMVQILLDENGSITSATAISGHPLLRQAAVEAAKKATFAPTILSGKAVRVSGVLTFNFTPE